MSSPTYRYILSIDDINPQIVVPILDSTQAFSFKREDDQVFHRKALDGGDIIFANADYDIIYGAPSEAKFTVDKAKLNEFGIYEVVFNGVFYKTDCKFDHDQRQVSVQPDPEDGYKGVLEIMDKEFDLITLAPPKFSVQYKKQPVFQYILVSNNQTTVASTLTNIVGGISYEEELTETPANGGELVTDYAFGLMGSIGSVTGEVGMSPDISGEYLSGLGGWSRTSDDLYLITLEGGELVCKLKASGVIVYRATDPGGSSALYDDWILVSETTGATAKFIYRGVYGRFLTNITNVDGQPTNDLPSPDLAPSPPGYAKCISIGDAAFGVGDLSVTAGEVLVAANDHSPTPSPYPVIPNDATFFGGEYLQAPIGFEPGVLYPIGQRDWSQVSFWVSFNAELLDYKTGGTETRVEFNAYRIEDVIQSILTAGGINLTFEADADHSDFFFNPTNPLKPDSRVTWITPKSNIIVGDYSNPASKAPIKLIEVLTLLWGAYRCKWYVDGLKFRVEHIRYFHNGLSYSAPNVGVDLTTLTEPKTGLPWGYKSGKWQYDKSKMPAELQYKWMDDVSIPFEGYPIIPQSNIIDKGNNEQVNVGRFTTDIDYIILSPADVNKRGFFAAEADIIGDSLGLIPIASVATTNAGTYTLQNPYMAYIYLHDAYHKDDLPSSSVNINLEVVSANSVRRVRLQTIEIPGDVVTEATIMTLVTSTLGSGLIREYTARTDGSGGTIVVEHDLV